MRGSISVGSCVTKDYTLHTRSLRNTAGRRAAQCEEMRRVAEGKKMVADMTETAAAGPGSGAGVARTSGAGMSHSRRCEVRDYLVLVFALAQLFLPTIIVTQNYFVSKKYFVSKNIL